MRYTIQHQTLANIANAIKQKTGDDTSITPTEMPEKIASIQAALPIFAFNAGGVWNTFPNIDNKLLFTVMEISQGRIVQQFEFDLNNVAIYRSSTTFTTLGTLTSGELLNVARSENNSIIYISSERVLPVTSAVIVF